MSQFKTDISVLPPEILVKIFQYISFEDLPNVRSVCLYFNELVRPIQASGLRRLRRTATKAVERFMITHGLRQDHRDDVRRLAKEAESLYLLASILEFADAGSFHLIEHEALPPLPGRLLQNVYNTVTIAICDPLVPPKRILELSDHLKQYWKQASLQYQGPQEGWPPVDETALLHTVIDLMDILPHKRVEIKPNKTGLQVDCWTQPQASVAIPDDDAYTKSDLTLVLWLKISCMVHLFENFPTCAGGFMPKDFSFHLWMGLNFSFPSVYQLYINCDPSYEANTLMCLKEIPVEGFQLTWSSDNCPLFNLPSNIVFASSTKFVSADE